MATVNASTALTGQSDAALHLESSSLSGVSSLTANGEATPTIEKPSIIHVEKYVGEASVPQDVKRRRRQVFEVMRRLGSPVIVKHMFTDADVKSGLAEPSPAFDSIYKQSRNEDPLSHGIGYVSVEKSETEWIDPRGRITNSRVNPGAGYIQAPRYRGFGPGYLVWVIQPDVAQDFFKLTETGALIQVSTATVQAPWYPEMNDNDLMVNVVLDNANNIIETNERYQLKMTNPVSMRGLDRRGRREYTEAGGNRFVINQAFQMTLVPTNNVLYNVETDR